MGLSSALATAMTGLRRQASLSIISSNVSNAQTPGYVAQTANQIEFRPEVSAPASRPRVSIARSTCSCKPAAHRDLRRRLCRSDRQYSRPVAERLRNPGRGNGTLETALSNFTTALQSLSNNAGSHSAQAVALSAAQSLAQQLNTTTQGVQIVAEQCPAGHRQFGGPGQWPDESDRAAQQPSAGIGQQ